MIRRRLWVPVVLLATACGYNRIQALDERVAETRSNIETELVRRNDLIPNLVSTVDQAAQFERGTFTDVARARSGLAEASEQVSQAIDSDAEPGELSRASAAVRDNLRAFINVAVEAYPTLRANQSFVALQDELSATENRIAVARRDYNEAVRTYNTYIRQFPQVLTARAVGADRKQSFEAPESATAPPKVQFNN